MAVKEPVIAFATKQRSSFLLHQQNGNAKRIDDDDTVSLFVFGEEESTLAAEAEQNNGIVPHERVANHHFPIETLISEKQNVFSVSLWILPCVWLLWPHFHLHTHSLFSRARSYTFVFKFMCLPHLSFW